MLRAFCEIIHPTSLQLKDTYQTYCSRGLSCDGKLLLTRLRTIFASSFEDCSVWLVRLKLRRRMSLFSEGGFSTGKLTVAGSVFIRVTIGEWDIYCWESCTVILKRKKAELVRLEKLRWSSLCFKTKRYLFETSRCTKCWLNNISHNNNGRTRL